MNLHGILNKRQGRLRIARPVAMLAAIGVAMLGGIAVAATAQATAGLDHKDYVCKYVGKPGVDERLQEGGNPIWVDTAATQLGWFNDAQGRSFVIVFNTPRLVPEPSIDKCPAPNSVPVLPPAYTPPTCDAQGSIDLGDSNYYDWVLNGDTGLYTAVAKAVPGSRMRYSLTGTRTFGPFPLAQLTDCKPVTPPVYTQPPCGVRGSVVAAQSDFYTWVITGTEDVPIYTATPKAIPENEDLRINGNHLYNLILPTVFTFHLAAVPCPTIIRDVPGISLVKVATVVETDADNGVANSGESILYTFNVANIGNVALSDVTVIDAIVAVGTVTCPATTLAVGATFTCTAAAFPVTDLNATGSPIVNGATASGQPPRGDRVSVTAFATTPTAVVAGEVVTVEPVTAPGNVPANVPVKVGKGAVVTKATVSPAKVTALAFTGAETVPLGLSGLLALLLGAGLVAIARRQGRRANN